MVNTLIPSKQLSTAVLFLVFNRPDTTAQVFEAIRKARPPRLYVAADGPREKCQLVEGEDAEVGQRQARAERGAREVEGLETRPPREEGGQRRVRAGDAHDPRPRPQRGQAVTGRARVPLGLGEPGHAAQRAATASATTTGSGTVGPSPATVVRCITRR